MQNHSYDNDFDLPENETTGRTHFFTLTRFETGSRGLGTDIVLQEL